MTTFRPRSSIRGRYRFAELAMAPGPATLADTGDNSYAVLFGWDWLVQLRRDDDMLLAYQRQPDGSWLHIDSPDLPPVFDGPHPNARRVTFAFDQSARMVVALEVAGSVEVTRWDSDAQAYTQDVTFAGHDPAIINDAAITWHIPGSDVVLFYLSDDRRTVRSRAQRENYATPHDLHTASAPAVLDRVQPLSWRYQLLASDEHGNPWDDVLRSDLYPVRQREAVELDAAGPTGGSHVRVVIEESGGDPVTATAAGPTGGDYVEPLIVEDVGTVGTMTTTTNGPTGGDYTAVVLTESTDAEGATATAAGPTGGDYTEVIITEPTNAEPLAATAAGPTGGTYATP